MRLKATGVKNKFSTLKRSMFIRECEFPLLKGKAAELKHFLRPLLGAFVNFMDAADEIDKRIKSLLTVSVEMEDILEVNKDRFKFDRDVSARFEQRTHAFHQLNTALAKRSPEPRLRRLCPRRSTNTRTVWACIWPPTCGSGDRLH